MGAGQDARKAGERVEALLAELGTQAGPQVALVAEELVTCLVELYGAGLTQVVAILNEDEGGPQLMDKLAADPLVCSLLLLHDLHPLPVLERVRRAVDEVLPRLGAHAGRVEFAGLDEAGVIRLRLERGGHGCSSSSAAVVQALSEAVAEAAPEAAGVDIDVVTPPAELPLLQITRHPAAKLPTIGRGSR